jgi:ferredoxin
VKKQDNKLHLCLCFCFCVYDLKDGERIFNPKFNHKDTISLRCDYIVFAIGQLADRKYFKELLDEKGRLKADPLTLATSKEGIFVGGDALRIGRACEAIKAGKQAAESIKMYLEKKDLKTKRQSKQYINPNLAYEKKHIPFKASERPPYLKVEERLASFALEQGGFSLEQLILETERCLHCGSCDNCKACISLGFRENLSKIEVIEQRCDGCGYCVDVCVYEAIKIIEYIKEAQIKKTIEVNLDLCRGCGLCQATCPKEGCLIPGFSLAQLKERIESYLNEHYKS